MSSLLDQLSDDVSIAIDWYLDNATEDNNENIRIFSSQIRKYGDLLILPGLLQICIRLRKLAFSTMTEQYMSSPMARYADKMIMEAGVSWIGKFTDVITELKRIGDAEGNTGKGHSELLIGLDDAGPDGLEDVSALCAIMLALPPFRMQLSIDHLRRTHTNAKGTSKKIAIQFALLANNDMEYFGKYAIRYLCDPQIEDSSIQELQYKYRYESREKIKLEFYKSVSYPEIIQLVCFDIATNGLGPKHIYRDWVRVGI